MVKVQWEFQGFQSMWSLCCVFFFSFFLFASLRANRIVLLLNSWVCSTKILSCILYDVNYAKIIHHTKNDLKKSLRYINCPRRRKKTQIQGKKRNERFFGQSFFSFEQQERKKAMTASETHNFNRKFLVFFYILHSVLIASVYHNDGIHFECEGKKKETEKKEIHDNIRTKKENAIFGMYARHKKGNELYFMLLKSVWYSCIWCSINITITTVFWPLFFRYPSLDFLLHYMNTWKYLWKICVRARLVKPILIWRIGTYYSWIDRYENFCALNVVRR